MWQQALYIQESSFTEDCFPLHLITNFLLSKQENMVENADKKKVLIIREFSENRWKSLIKGDPKPVRLPTLRGSRGTSIVNNVALCFAKMLFPGLKPVIFPLRQISSDGNLLYFAKTKQYGNLFIYHNH